MKLFKVVAFLFFYMCIHYSTAQNNQFQNFTINDGLPQSQVTDIVQDSFGYLWLGTQGGGIARFDGERFTVYNDKNGLSSNFINALAIRNDSLLIGTNQGLSIKTKNKFTNLKSPKVLKFISINRQVYIATAEGVYALKSNYIVPVAIDLQIDLSSVNDIVFDGVNYWFATNKGLWKTNGLVNPSKVERVDKNTYTSLLPMQSKLLAASQKNGIKVFEEEKVYTIHKSIKYINDIQKITADEIWVSTLNKGFSVLSVKDLSIKRNINTITGLKSNGVNKAFKDRDKNIWIASVNSGLYYTTQHNFKYYNTNTRLQGNKVSAVHYNNGKIWLSNAKNNLLNIGYLGIEDVYISNKRLDVTTITSDKLGNIWIGTKRNGIYINRENGIEKLHSNNGFLSDNINKIVIQSDTIWVATQSSGIVKLDYDFEKGFVKNTTVFNNSNGVSELSITSITVENAGSVWYATETGFLGLIKNNNVEKEIQVTDNKTPINTIKVHKGRMFVGTLGDGVWWSNVAHLSTFQKLQGEQELVSKNIYQLLFDNEQQLWLGTEKGVDRIQLNDSNLITKINHFGKNDGFIGIETSLNAIDKDNIGNIWFGTTNGISQYIATNNSKKSKIPKVFFEKIEIAYQALDSIDPNNYAKEFFLSPQQNHISFQYKTIDLNNAENVEYRWKLQGDYSPWSKRNSINFANLEAGNYAFKVQSRNKDLITSRTKTFLFFIDKPLHQKTWFITLIIGFVSILIIVFIVAYNKQIKRKNSKKIKQLELDKHLLLLEQKALQLQMNPHFIFNVLNGIKGMGNSGDTMGLNKTISNFATLLRAVLNNSRKEEISLQQEINTLKNYIELEQQMATSGFVYTIDTAKIDLDLDEILIPPMLIQPFVENSIKHGFKNNSKKGVLTISFNIKNDFLSCSILDNGIGIEQSKIEKRITSHQSIALKVTSERIESLAGKNTLKIVELVEKEIVIGTKVEFEIPLKTDY